MTYDYTRLVIPPQAGRLIELAECLCATILAETGLGLCWCGVYPGGTPAWEACGGCAGDVCGMGYVTMDTASMYTTFGIPNTNSHCDTLMQAGVSLGVLRCMPVEEDGSSPSQNDMSDTAMLLFADMMAIRKAALCCYEGDVLLQGYEALGANGGCIGGQWRGVISLD